MYKVLSYNYDHRRNLAGLKYDGITCLIFDFTKGYIDIDRGSVLWYNRYCNPYYCDKDPASLVCMAKLMGCI